MDKAKAAVSEFVGRSGRHDTTVDERQAPAVMHQDIQPIRKEEVTTAVDREVDQDHYHTTVQPIKDREVLPEKHSHQMAGVQHKEFEHANPTDVRARLDREAQQFKDTSITRNTQHTQVVAPTVEGERIHHHVHETVQPVIEKETIAPSVVHTTVPVHERHHAAPEHHGTSVLPTKTMTDFKSTGQKLTGSTGIINQDKYDGCPRPYNAEMQIGRTDADANPHAHTSGIGSQHGSSTTGPHSSNIVNKADPRVDSDRDGRGIGAGTAGVGAGMTGAGMTGTHDTHSTAGPHGSNMANKADPRVDSDRDGSNRGMGTGVTGTSNTGAGPYSSNAANKLDPRVDSDRSGGHHQGASSAYEGTSTGRHGDGLNSGAGRVGGTDSTPIPTGTSSHASGVGDTAGHKKPSLLDRLNPMKDSDGDGQKGFMK